MPVGAVAGSSRRWRDFFLFVFVLSDVFEMQVSASWRGVVEMVEALRCTRAADPLPPMLVCFDEKWTRLRVDEADCSGQYGRMTVRRGRGYPLTVRRQA